MAETNERALTKQQQAFVDAYICDPEMNATDCVRKAYPNCKYPDKLASQLLGNTRVNATIKKAQDERSKRTEITQDMVLQRWWGIATADPNEIIQFRRLCCRHCFGKDHEYQWTDEKEFSEAVERAIKDAKEDEEPMIPPNSGGYGYDRLIRPHPKCPNCMGEGRGDIKIADTRDLSPQAKALYAGVKTTASGIEIKLHDQLKALDSVSRHLGMFNDRVEMTVKEITVQLPDELS